MANPLISLQCIREMAAGEKEQLLENIEREANDNEVKYWGCSQAVLHALQRNLNLGDGGAFKAASALAGGVAKTREACGALIGGVMAIGLAYGRSDFEKGKVAVEQPEFREAMVRSTKFCEQFIERFGSLRCADVKASIRGAAYKEYTSYNTIEAFQDHAKCGEVTGPAARLAAEIILQPTELFADEINTSLEEMRQLRKQLEKI